MTRTLPAPLRAARAILGLIALAHIAIPLVMLARADALRDDIRSAHPDYDADTLSAAVTTAQLASVVFHGLVVLVTLLVIAKLPTGRPWVRRLLVISQALGIVFSLVSWSSSAMFHAVIPVLDLLQLAVVLLALVPESSRAHFGRATADAEPSR